MRPVWTQVWPWPSLPVRPAIWPPTWPSIWPSGPQDWPEHTVTLWHCDTVTLWNHYGHNLPSHLPICLSVINRPTQIPLGPNNTKSYSTYGISPDTRKLYNIQLLLESLLSLPVKFLGHRSAVYLSRRTPPGLPNIMNTIFYNLDKNTYNQNKASTTKKKSFTFKMETQLSTLCPTITQSWNITKCQENFHCWQCYTRHCVS